MAKCWLSRPKNLIPRTKETKGPVWQLSAGIAVLGGQRWVDPWGLLPVQPTWRVPDQWKTLSQRTRRRVSERERERHLKLTSGIHTHMNPCVQYQHSHMHSYIQPPGYTHTNRKVDCLGTFFQITLHHDHTDGLQVNKPGSSQSQAWKNSWSPRDSSKGLLLTAPLLQPSVNPNELRAARNYKAKQRYWEIVEASTCFNATNLVGSVGELTPVLTDRRLRCS